MAGETLERMVREKYSDPALQDAILEDIAALGTEEAIMKGERTLPSPQDALYWHQRKIGTFGMSEKEREQEDRLRVMQEVMEEMLSSGGDIDPERRKVLAERMAILTSGRK